MKKIVIAAGGSGGHLLPAQALADRLVRSYPDVQIVFVGFGLDTSPFFSRKKWIWKQVCSASISMRPFWRGLKGIFSVAKGICQAISFLLTSRPDLVVGFGSYHSFPALFAARVLQIPLVLHEGNSIPGKVNRLFSSYAKVSAIYLPEAAQYLKGHSIPVTMPLRDGYQRPQVNQRSARLQFGLDPDTFTFLVFGGSQGAQALNTLFSKAICDHLCKTTKRYQIIHLTGSRQVASQLTVNYEEAGIAAYVKPYEKEMDQVWAAADLVISRAGACTIAEELELEVPGILVPYPFAADGHQNGNADFMVEKVKGAVKFYESELNSEKLADAIRNLAKGKQLEVMRKNMQEYKKGVHLKNFETLVAEVAGLKQR